jgi:hypothetical protein
VACCLSLERQNLRQAKLSALSQIATRRGGLVGRTRDCSGEQATSRQESTHLLELLDGTLVNSTALVDQVCNVCESLCSVVPGARRGMLTTGGGRLAGVDVADDHDVDVKLLLTADVVRLCSFVVAVDAWWPWRALEDGRTPS